MITKSQMVFLLAFAIGVCALCTRPAQAGNDIIAPEVFSRFQQQGGEFSRDMRNLEAVLSRIRHKKKSGGSLQAERAEFRALRSSAKAAQKAFMKKLAQMEDSLVDNGAEPLFIERHRALVQKFQEKFSELAERLDREDMDDLTENGLRFTWKNSRDKKARQLKIKKTAPKSELPTQSLNIEAITQPEKVEIKDEAPGMLLPTDGKLGLLQTAGSYRLVKFELPAEKAPSLTDEKISTSHGASRSFRLGTGRAAKNVPRPFGGEGAGAVFDQKSSMGLNSDSGLLNSERRTPDSELKISPVTAWDVDLPQSVRPVMVAGLGDMAGLLSQATLQAITPPADADRAADGIDIVFSDEIKALAESLGRDPIRIYEYVKNTIEYQPYWGSLKGAQETLLSKQGNDCDQASLLIALLRYSGYPARYGQAVATVDIGRAKSWLGVESGQMAVNLLFSMGVPDVLGLSRSSQLVQVQFRHMYAEVYLPYENYRGQVRSNGGQKLWVPLSPSFKQHRVTPGIDLAAAVPFDPASMFEGATVGEDGAISGIDPAAVRGRMDAYTGRVQ
ncbi:MAG: transglutaminase domain-containing protein, partial [Deltaproteobacteria bacterium]|nr:transglutaminase domain-containing protein [Deltaproteobacteria bacterium]